MDGDEAWRKIQSGEWDVILLDVMLPHRDGLEICRQLRQEKNYTPVIMLTARDDEIDRVVGLEIGADDYVTKPFSVRELMARIKVILRRRNLDLYEGKTGDRGRSDTHPPRKLRSVLKGAKGRSDPQRVRAPYLAGSKQGRVLKRDYLLQRLWDYGDTVKTRVLDVHVSKLREKLASYGLKGGGIETVRGIGYKF